MDLREAIACLDEYRISLANIGGMLRPNIAEGELGEAIKKLNDSLIETLNAQEKEAMILSIMIWRELKATHEQVVDFPDGWADLLVALNQLNLATDTAAEARAEYLRKKPRPANVNAKGNELKNAFQAVRAQTRTNEQRRERRIRSKDGSKKSPPDLVETLNTPDPTEV